MTMITMTHDDKDKNDDDDGEDDNERKTTKDASNDCSVMLTKWRV